MGITWLSHADNQLSWWVEVLNLVTVVGDAFSINRSLTRFVVKGEGGAGEGLSHRSLGRGGSWQRGSRSSRKQSRPARIECKNR